jgi:hypothetical protein
MARGRVQRSILLVAEAHALSVQALDQEMPLAIKEHDPPGQHEAEQTRQSAIQHGGVLTGWDTHRS